MPVTATPLHTALGVFFLPPTGAHPGRSHTGIVFEVDERYVHAVAFYAIVDCVRLPRDVVLTPVLLAGLPYPVAKAAAVMLGAGFPVADRARLVLEGLVT